MFNNIASCSEIPDAIGWSSCHKWRGSTLVECKTSAGDFYADKRKYFFWKHSEKPWRYPMNRFSKKEAEEQGYQLVESSRMGIYRFFLCDPGLVTEEMLLKHAPDHGLLHFTGNRVRMIKAAPERQRELVDWEAEIRYLRFAIINKKKAWPYVEEIVETPQQGNLELAQREGR